jgi:hypothetical protein
MQNYNFTCSSVWVRNLVSDIKGGKRPLGRPRRRWVGNIKIILWANIKIDLGEIGWDGLDRSGSG